MSLRGKLTLAMLLVAAGLSAPVPAEGPMVASSTEKKLDDATIERILKIQEEQEVAVRLVLLRRASRTRRAGSFPVSPPRTSSSSTSASPKRSSTSRSRATSRSRSPSSSTCPGACGRAGSSMRPRKRSATSWTSCGPQDRFALICFADEQVSWVTEFTADRERFLERLLVQEGYGQTALNDAVAAAPKLVDESIKGRKAIVLITDGVDKRQPPDRQRGAPDRPAHRAPDLYGRVHDPALGGREESCGPRGQHVGPALVRGRDRGRDLRRPGTPTR